MNEQSKLTDERAAFERWITDEGGNLTRHADNQERYASSAVQGRWLAWNRRAALAAQPVAPAEPVAWAICMKGGRGVQRLYYAKPTENDLLYWDRDAGWNDLAPHIIVPLYAAPPAAREGWQPIETAPKDGSLFLCWVSAIRYGETDEGQQYQQDASQVDFCSWRDGPPDLPGHGYFDPCCGQIADSQDVTHWQPLPAPPEQP